MRHVRVSLASMCVLNSQRGTKLLLRYSTNWGTWAHHCSLSPVSRCCCLGPRSWKQAHFWSEFPFVGRLIKPFEAFTTHPASQFFNLWKYSYLTQIDNKWTPIVVRFKSLGCNRALRAICILRCISARSYIVSGDVMDLWLSPSGNTHWRIGRRAQTVRQKA
jgi:hypothetical protein